MTADQITLFTLLFFVFVFLIWGRWRYDLVAFVALLAATGVDGLTINASQTEALLRAEGTDEAEIKLVESVSRDRRNSVRATRTRKRGARLARTPMKLRMRFLTC